MSIQVSLGGGPDKTVRVESEDGLLKLPAILVEPTDPNAKAVLVQEVRATVSGPDPGAALLDSAYGSGNPLVTLENDDDHQGGEPLVEGVRVRPYEIRLADEPLPPDRYVLRAEVDYRFPPAFPGAQPGRLVTVTEEVLLDVPHDLARQCHLTAHWKRREAVVGRSAAELVVAAENLPAGSTVRVALAEPDKVESDTLTTILVERLQHYPPTKSADRGAATLFQQEIEIEMAAADRHAAIQSEPLLVPLRISAVAETNGNGNHNGNGKDEGPTRKELAVLYMSRADDGLLVDFEENVFPGYPIVDIGTSSTFAVLHYSQLKSSFLPIEQEQCYRRGLTQLLQRRDGVFGSPHWNKLLASAVRLVRRAQLQGDAADVLLAYLKQNRPTDESAPDNGVHAVVRAVELAAMTMTAPPEVQLAVRRELAELHQNAFRTFPLEHQLLIAVDLDPDRSQRESDEPAGSQLAQPISSTTEVVGCHPLDLSMGANAVANQRAAMAADPGSLTTRFHASPKNYYPWLGLPNKRIPVSVGGEVTQVTPREFLVAALRQLRSYVERFRRTSAIVQNKRFKTIVLPFPTSAPMSVRRELIEVAREAGFDDPVVELDEALSAVVFYLVNPFGDDKEMGLEAFRCSCRPVPRGHGQPTQQWLQNILLIDIGGGTSDIALVEVLLTDETPARFDGTTGRYYRLTPKLLGATGRPQMAGNLLTLGLFHSLKARIADAVLTATAGTPETSDAAVKSSDGQEAVDRFRKLADELPPELQDQDGGYRTGALIDHYPLQRLWNEKDDRAAQAAYQWANSIVPTAWNRTRPGETSTAAPDPRIASRFHELWTLAEATKVDGFGDGHDRVTITSAQIGQLLGLDGGALAQLGDIEVTVDHDAFRAAVDPALQTIADLAIHLTNDRLGVDHCSTVDPETADDEEVERDEPIAVLDRIILTGQTCRLPRTSDIIVEKFREQCDDESARFRWDPSHLTNEVEHAKQAAAIGAAYAQVRYDRQVDPVDKIELRSNVLEPQIQNLFFFLSSGFKLREPSSASGYKTLFVIGSEFTEFDSDAVGHLRTHWDVEPRKKLNIDRFDFDTDPGTPWGEFDCQALADEGGIPFDEFRSQVRCAVETDHRLLVSVLFCRGGQPHFEWPEMHTVDVSQAARDHNLVEGRSDSQSADRPTEATDSAAESAPSNWIAGLEGWTIELNSTGPGRSLLFRLGTEEFNTTFRVEEGETRRPVRGWVSTAPLPPAPASGTDRIYLRPPDNRQRHIEIGQLNRPVCDGDRRAEVRVVLNERGQLGFHLGELPLWIVDDARGLSEEGAVVRRPLLSPDPKPNELTDPFCGRH